MKKKIVYFFALILSMNFSFSQSVLSSEEISLNSKKDVTSISIVDKHDNINLLFVAKKTITHIKYDHKFTLLFKNEYEKPSEDFFEILGYNIGKENTINIYFSDAWKKRFSLFSIDTNNQSSTKNFNLKIKREAYFCLINNDDKFHYLTYSKGGSEIIRYTFEDDQYTVNNYDFSKSRFINNELKAISLSKLFNFRTASVIENDVPTSIELTSNKIKVYPRKDKAIITLNHRKRGTRVIDLSLLDNTFKLSNFNIPTASFYSEDLLKSNSFVLKNKIYQFISSKNKLNFLIHDLTTLEKIKQYSIDKKEEIMFKNSSIYQEGGTYVSNSKERELDNTRQFLRKISIAASQVGITAFEKNNQIYLTMGGVAESTIGGSSPLSAGSSSHFSSFLSYTSTRSVYIKCLFDENTLDHIEGDVEENVFDKIYSFSEKKEIAEKLRLKTIFKYKNYLVQGSYSKKNSTYKLLRFDW